MCVNWNSQFLNRDTFRFSVQIPFFPSVFRDYGIPGGLCLTSYSSYNPDRIADDHCVVWAILISQNAQSPISMWFRSIFSSGWQLWKDHPPKGRVLLWFVIEFLWHWLPAPVCRFQDVNCSYACTCRCGQLSHFILNEPWISWYLYLPFPWWSSAIWL